MSVEMDAQSILLGVDMADGHNATHTRRGSMRTDHIAQLVRKSLYEVDADAIAKAILARTLARQLIPETEFRNDLRGGSARVLDVRSFRHSGRARSFHLAGPRRSPRGC
jgi:hypothetical protein